MARPYVIQIDGQDIEVTEEVYRFYKRSVWNERNRRRYRIDHEASIDAMRENGLELASDEALLEDIVTDRIMLEALLSALQSLAEKERSLIYALYFDEQTEREAAQSFGISCVAVHKQKRRIIDKLKKIFS